MKTVIHKRGFIQELWTLITNLSTAIKVNVNDIWDSLAHSGNIPGVIMDWDGSVYDDALKVALSDPTHITVQPGQGVVGLTLDGTALIKVESLQTLLLSDYVPSPIHSDYNVFIKWAAEYSDAVPYDKSYASDGYTLRSDGYEFDIRVPGTSPVSSCRLATLHYDGANWSLVSDDRTPFRLKNILIPASVYQTPPPAPTRLRATTGFDATWRADQPPVGVAGMPGVNPPGTLRAYVRLKFGDTGEGSVTGHSGGNPIWTKTTTELVWVADEWIGQFLTDENGDSWEVIDNDVTTLTLEDKGSDPADGDFWLGPNAKGYRYDIDVLIPVDPPEHWKYQQEVELAESPTKMEIVIHGLEPNTTYEFKVASLAGWNQEEQSAWSSAVTVVAGGTKAIPEACEDALVGGAILVELVDGGVRLSWEVKDGSGGEHGSTDYTGDVAGLEIAWTDDGSPPDFDDPPATQYRGVAQSSPVILTSRLSTTDHSRTLRFISRLVDHAGRHCTTPYIATPVTLNQGVSSLYDEVVAARRDHRGIVYSTLQNRLLASLGALGYEMEAAREGYSSVAARMDAIQRGVVDWGNTRIVAKTGGQYTDIQAAIDSIPANTTQAYTILVYTGEYIEAGGQITVNDGKRIHLIGMGSVSIKNTRLIADNATSGKILSIQNVAFNYLVSNGIEDIPVVGLTGTDTSLLLCNVDVLFDATSQNDGGIIELQGTNTQVCLEGVRIIDTSPTAPYPGDINCIEFLAGSIADNVVLRNCYLLCANEDCVDLSATLTANVPAITMFACETKAGGTHACVLTGQAGQIVGSYHQTYQGGTTENNALMDGPGTLQKCGYCWTNGSYFPSLLPMQGQQE